MPGFEWTETTEKAAQLIAEGRLTYSAIAAELDVDRKTVWAWRQEPEFTARVDAILEEFREETRRLGLAVLERRLAALNDRWLRLLRVIDERAADPSMQAAAGGKTGMLVRTLKRMKVGDEGPPIDIDEFAVDVALSRELREIEKQAGIMLGQWTTHHKIDLSHLSDADLLAKAKGLLGRAGAAGADPLVDLEGLGLDD